MADLQDIISKINDEAIHENVEKHHLNARQEYKLDKWKVADFKEFKEKITEYTKHHKKITDGVDYSDEKAYQDAKEAIQMAYQQQGKSWEDAVKDARDGKLKNIIDTLSQVYTMKHTQAWKEHVIDDHIDPTDFDAQKTIADQYVKEWGQHLPEDITKKGPDELAKEYKNLLNNHQDLTKQIKQYLEK
ncbi:MAG: hypothetical protein ACLFP2_01115 [Candidatus Woesearchaeota archaeon]